MHSGYNLQNDLKLNTFIFTDEFKGFIKSMAAFNETTLCLNIIAALVSLWFYVVCVVFLICYDFGTAAILARLLL